MNRSSDSLKYRHIEQQLVSTIQSGSYRTGDKLPSENDLAATFHASRSTVIRALGAVRDLGLIERRQGSGSYVTAKAMTHSPQRRLAFGLLKRTQSGRFADSVVDQVQARLATLLQQRESALILHTIDADDEPSSVASQLIEQRIGGVFFVPIPPVGDIDANGPIVDLFARAGRPVVLLDSDFTTPPHRSGFDVVGIENRHGGFVQTQHLLDLGLRRILYLGTDPPTPSTIERQAGYRDALSAAGIDAPLEWTCNVAADEITEAFVADVLARHRPEGIVCKSDEFAALASRHLTTLGVRVPDDLKIVGFDDRPIATLLPTTLTTIRQPIAEIASAALALMDARLREPLRAASRVQISGTLVARRSTNAAHLSKVVDLGIARASQSA